jgi:hypothetical protein
MDFIEALPKVVDRLSKYAHFILLAHPYFETTVAQRFFSEVVRLHGLPKSIVSDRDVVFTSKFWQELFCLSRVTLQMSLAYHPQSDDQSEVINKVIVMYLWCLTGDNPKEWTHWLPWAEFCYNTSYHRSINTTPFKLVYGQDPPLLKQYSLGDASTPSVDKLLAERDHFLEQTKLRLLQSQDYYKKHYDRKHTDRTFHIGDWVYLKLMARTTFGIFDLRKGKLAPKFFSPFQIVTALVQLLIG